MALGIRCYLRLPNTDNDNPCTIYPLFGGLKLLVLNPKPLEGLGRVKGFKFRASGIRI